MPRASLFTGAKQKVSLFSELNNTYSAPHESCNFPISFLHRSFQREGNRSAREEGRGKRDVGGKEKNKAEVGDPGKSK